MELERRVCGSQMGQGGEPGDLRGLARILSALLLFGIAFGFVEAAVVVYLRTIYEPIHERLVPGYAAGDLFPLLQLSQIAAEGPAVRRCLEIELLREAATLLMLAAVALAVARTFRQWFAAYLISFGLWDIFYYVFLRLLLGWPASLYTWDILFLLPVPWAGPVLAPCLVALSMIVAGVLVLWRDAAGRPIELRWYHWTGFVAGGLLIIGAFCWDFQNLLAGGKPNPFNWPLLLLGETTGFGCFVHALLTGRCQEVALAD